MLFPEDKEEELQVDKELGFLVQELEEEKILIEILQAMMFPLDIMLRLEATLNRRTMWSPVEEQVPLQVLTMILSGEIHLLGGQIRGEGRILRGLVLTEDRKKT